MMVLVVLTPTLPQTTEQTHLYVVDVGAGLSEDGWDRWVAAHFQVIFGALVLLQEIREEAS